MFPPAVERLSTFQNNIWMWSIFQTFARKSCQTLSSISHKKLQTTFRSWQLDRNKFTRTNMHILQQWHCWRIPLFVSMQKIDEHRTQLIKPYYYKRPNILKYHDLINTSNRKQLKDLCHYIKHIMTNVSQWTADFLNSLSHVLVLLHAKDKGTDRSARLQTQPVPWLFAPCRDKWSNFTYLKFTVWVNLCGWSWSFRSCSVTSHKGRFLVQKSRDILTATKAKYF